MGGHLIVHRTNRLVADLALLVNHRAPIVITALGAPTAVIETIHGYGGTVLADVNSVAHARKAAAAGADGLVLLCAGAGGHNGKLTPFAFVPAMREFFDGPLMVGGGISDGPGVRAVEMLGADLAYVGTGFIASQESLAPASQKHMLIESGIEDVVESRAVTGIAANWLKPSLEAYGIDPAAIVPPNLDQPDVGGKRWKDIWPVKVSARRAGSRL